MSGDETDVTPDLDCAFFVWRVTTQSLGSASLPFTTSLGKVSVNLVSQCTMENSVYHLTVRLYRSCGKNEASEELHREVGT
jgi:hypothetical protein